jgi:hypothetical protein
MRWLGRGLVLLVLGAACASLKPTPAPEKTASDAPDETAAAADASAFLEVRDVRVATVGAGRRITIVLSREPEGMQDFWLASPPRLVVDLTGPRAENPPTVATYPFPDEVVSQVRVGAHGGSLRAVIDLARNPGAHAVRREGLTLIADLGGACCCRGRGVARAAGASAHRRGARRAGAVAVARGTGRDDRARWRGPSPDHLAHPLARSRT